MYQKPIPNVKPSKLDNILRNYSENKIEEFKEKEKNNYEKFKENTIIKYEKWKENSIREYERRKEIAKKQKKTLPF